MLESSPTRASALTSRTNQILQVLEDHSVIERTQPTQVCPTREGKRLLRKLKRKRESDRSEREPVAALMFKKRLGVKGPN